MTDHPLLIPTSEGPVGAVVSAPDCPAVAAMILLAGYGRPARSGVNGFWTRLARTLAERGALVLRPDYSREGETLPIGEGGSGQIWKRDLDLSLLRQVAPWFRQRAPSVPLLLAGSCSGGRLALECAADMPEAVAGTFLVVPYLRELAQPGREDRASQAESDPVDPSVVECCRRLLPGARSRVLVGENDDVDVALLQHRLGSLADRLEVEVVPGAALHLLDTPQLQAVVADSLVAWTFY